MKTHGNSQDPEAQNASASQTMSDPVGSMSPGQQIFFALCAVGLVVGTAIGSVYIFSDTGKTRGSPTLATETNSENKAATYYTDMCNLARFESVKGAADFQAESKNRSSVTGGEEVAPGQYEEYPNVVLLMKINAAGEYFTCTGSILDHQHVLTAAHCIFNMIKTPRALVGLGVTDFYPISPSNRLLVYLGRLEGGIGSVKIQAAYVYIHSFYDSVNQKKGYDIAVVRLDEAIQFNGNVRPTCLANCNDQPGPCDVVGFGETESGLDSSFPLMRAQGLNLLSTEECRQQFIHILSLKNPNFSSEIIRESFDDSLIENKLCLRVTTDGKGICQGDSGGPLLCTTIGQHASRSMLKQFGVVESNVNPCGQNGSLNFFVPILFHRTWLHFAAYPLLHDAERSMKHALQQFTTCALELTKHLLITKTTHLFSQGEFNATCRFFVAYESCVKAHPTPLECRSMAPASIVLPDTYLFYEDLLKLPSA